MPFPRLALLAVLACLLVPSAARAAGTPLYPDLITLPPRDLMLDRADVSVDGSGDFHNVLRFSNTVANVGEGPLDMHGSFTTDPNSAPAIQWIYDAAGNVVAKHTVGSFYWHAIHQHYHFDNWGRYELWTKAGWNAYLAAGRPSTMQPDIVGTKTTSCVLDDEFIKSLPATPWPAVHPSAGCFPDDHGQMDQGMSVGWGDTYDYFRQEQWIDLDQSTLPDGDYVLRSVTDPLNHIWESPSKADPAREGQPANEAVTPFTISGGKLVDTQRPSGTVWIDGVAESTSTTAVTVRVLGRDDVSGVDKVRLSNDGVTWAVYPYGGAGTSPMVVNWDLADTRYGGSNAGGTRTVYAQFRDASGKWSPTIADTIDYTAGSGGGGGSSSAYAQTVDADNPVSYWRLDETSGATALDQFGRNDLGLRNSPGLGAASLLVSDPGDGAMAFDGFDQYGTNVTPVGVDPGQYVSVEAWIHPDAVPAPGAFASVFTKPEAWSLQFNGPRLEWTVIQNGIRERLQAPAGTVVPGQTYHVVGTYDGASQRLYVNGALVGQTALPGADDGGDHMLSLASWDGTTEYFDGTIDEAAVYDTLLTGVQVKSHYDAGIATAVGVFPPSNLVASSPDGASVDLGWTDNSNNETGFVIERSADSAFGSPTTISVPADTASYHDTGMPAGTYYYRVKAVTATYSSSWSNTATVTVTGTAPPSTYAQTVKHDWPAGYWRLDETSGTTAADAMGWHPGTYLGSPTLGATSLIADSAGHAAAFDGVDDAVRVPDAAGFHATDRLSLEAWIDPASLPAAGSLASVISKAGAYSLQFNGPRLALVLFQNGVAQSLLAPAGAVPAGQVSYVVATYDGARERIYVNGALVASRAQPGAADVNGKPLMLGSRDGTTQFLPGTIDEAAVYGKVLWPAGIQRHYTAGSPTGVSAPAARAAASVEPNLPVRRHVGPVKATRHTDPELVTRRFHGRLVRLVCPMDARRGR